MLEFNGKVARNNGPSNFSCAGANSSADFVSCARERTFSLEEAVPAAYKGFYLDYPETENLTGDNSWSWDLTNTLQGR